MPAYFTDSQKKATEDCGRLAGLDRVHLLSEPNAAALGYAHSSEWSTNSGLKQDLFVFDLGGGTLDVSLLRFDGKVLHTRGIYGDNYLGGVDIDKAIADNMMESIERAYPGIVMDSDVLYSRLESEAEAVKIALSDNDLATKPLHNIGVVDDVPFASLDYQLTRKEFEKLVPMRRILTSIRGVLQEIKQSGEVVDGASLLFVGGSTYIPCIRELVESSFKFNKVLLYDPDTAVAKGAALYAAHLDESIPNAVRPQISLVDATPFSLGIRARKKTARGIQTNFFKAIIPKSSPIPVAAEKTFQLQRRNQNTVKIEIYQDVTNRARVIDDCELIQEMRITDLPSSKGKKPHLLRVSFQITENNIFYARAEVQGLEHKASVWSRRSDLGDSRTLENDLTIEPFNLSDIAGNGEFDEYVLAAAHLLEGGVTQDSADQLLYSLIRDYLAASRSERADDLDAIGGMVVELLKVICLSDKAA